MKRILSKKGFTLTETLIGTVVLLILAGTASTIILSCFGIYGRTTKRNSAQSIGDTIYELISERLTYSAALSGTWSIYIIWYTAIRSMLRIAGFNLPTGLSENFPII